MEHLLDPRPSSCPRGLLIALAIPHIAHTYVGSRANSKTREHVFVHVPRTAHRVRTTPCVREGGQARSHTDVMHVCVCMYVCMYVPLLPLRQRCISVPGQALTYRQTDRQTDIQAYIHIHTCGHPYIHAYLPSYIRTYVRTYAYHVWTRIVARSDKKISTDTAYLCTCTISNRNIGTRCSPDSLFKNLGVSPSGSKPPQHPLHGYICICRVLRS